MSIGYAPSDGACPVGFVLGFYATHDGLAQNASPSLVRHVLLVFFALSFFFLDLGGGGVDYNLTVALCVYFRYIWKSFV